MKRPSFALFLAFFTVRLVLIHTASAQPIFVTPTPGPAPFYQEISGENITDKFGASLVCLDSTLPTVNADSGRVAIGAPGKTRTSYANVGDLAKRKPSEASGTTVSDTALQTITSLRADLQFGERVASVGDTSGDGISELLVSAPGDTANGKAYLFSTDLTYIATLTGGLSNEDFGTAITGWDDLTGLTALQPNGVADGKADFAVGAPIGNSSSGTVYVYEGSTRQQIAQIDGAASDQLGVALDTVGSKGSSDDADQDGVPDLVVGVPGSRTVKIFYAASARALWSQGTPIPSLSADNTITLGAGIEEFGKSVADVSDVDGDGIRDLLVGAPSQSVTDGRAFILAGPRYSISTPLCDIQGPDPSFDTGSASSFGETVLALGDIDNDGNVEFAVGEPGATVNSQSRAGRVHIFRYVKATTSCVEVEDVRPISPESAGEFGRSMAIRDCEFSNDGVRDLVVGAPALSSEDSPGKVHFFMALATPSATPTPTPTATPTSTPTFTATYTPTYTPTATATATVTLTFTPTSTPTSTPTDTPTPTATATPTPSTTPTTTPVALEDSAKEVKKELNQIVADSPPMVEQSSDNPNEVTITVPEISVKIVKKGRGGTKNASLDILAATLVKAKVSYTVQVFSEGGAKRRQLRELTSKRNVITVGRLPAGTYSSRYKVKVTPKKGPAVTTKFSPSTTFTLSP